MRFKNSPWLKFLLCQFLLLFFLAVGINCGASPAKRGKRYSLAKMYYNNLVHNKHLARSRNNWLQGIRHFRSIYEENREDNLAPACLFMTGVLYEQLYAFSDNPLDLGEAIANYEDVAAFFPHDHLADDALLALSRIFLTANSDPQRAATILAKIIALYPDGDMAQAATEKLQQLKIVPLAKAYAATTNESIKDLEKITDLRYGSTNYYTRVVIETTGPVKYEDHVLKQNKNHPERLYINLYECRIPQNLTVPIPIDDGLLTKVRSAQFSSSTVRVVLDTQSFSDYKISTQNNPARIIVDVWGQSQGNKRIETLSRQGKMPSLAQQLGLGAKRIIIDPGHGGKDPGALGPNGMLEKDIVLTVARMLAEKLHRDYSYEVILTRDTDDFLSLEERTEIANANNGDIFLSLHVNSAPSRKARGIETYFLSLASSPEEMRAAALENAASKRKMNELQAILMDLMQNSKVNESAKLAEFVQDSMITGLSYKYDNIHNLGVKKAPFIVLIGAQMPAVLVEIAFLSNKDEALRLKDTTYLNEVADKLSSGVSRYVSELNLAYKN